MTTMPPPVGPVLSTEQRLGLTLSGFALGLLPVEAFVIGAGALVGQTWWARACAFGYLAWVTYRVAYGRGMGRAIEVVYPGQERRAMMGPLVRRMASKPWHRKPWHRMNALYRGIEWALVTGCLTALVSLPWAIGLGFVQAVIGHALHVIGRRILGGAKKASSEDL